MRGRREGGERNDLPVSLPAGEDRDDVYREIYERYHYLVHTFFIRHGYSEDECRDLTQETFLRLFRNIGQFLGRSKFETWLFEIAKNVRLNEIRSRLTAKRLQREIPLEGGAESGRRNVPAAADGPLDQLLAAERARLLHAALKELSPQMRRCVELRLDHGMELREIAAAMEISVNTVKSHLAQARKKLRRRLTQSAAGGALRDLPPPS